LRSTVARVENHFSVLRSTVARVDWRIFLTASPFDGWMMAKVVYKR
jgi:hypothetical protein